MLLALPVIVQFYTTVDTYPQQQLERIAKHFNWLFVDPLPYMRKEKPQKVFFDQCHLTELGSEAVAYSLYRGIKTSPLMQMIHRTGQKE